MSIHAEKERAAAGRGLLPPFAIAACSIVFFWSISARALIYTLLPTIASDLQLSNSTAGLVISSVLLGYCAGGWAAGMLPGSRKARIMGGVLLSVPGVVMMSLSSSLILLILAALIMGLGVGVYLPLGLALMVDVGRDGRTAVYMATHEVAATFASFVGSTAVVVLLLWTDWHGSLLAWSVVGVVATLAFLAVSDPEDHHERRGSRESVPISLNLVYTIATYAVGTMLVMGLISMLPLIMVRAWGMEQAEAASVVGYTRLAGIVGVIIIALTGDRWGAPRILIGLQILCLAGTLAMALNGYGPIFIVGVLLLAAGASGNIGLLPMAIAQAYPPRQRERSLTLAAGLGGLLGMVAAPALFGLLLDIGLATGPLWFASAATFVAILATTRLAKVHVPGIEGPNPSH